MESTQILVVEDESIVAKDLARRLQDRGYAVPVVVSSGADAIQKAAETRPGLILMDIHLRGEMDGVEAAAQIRARFDIPVIYLTAYADEATLERAQRTEPFGYILKPFEERELQATIKIALYKHQVERRLKESEARYRGLYRGLFENANDGIVSMSLDGMITTVNRGLEVMLRWPREELIGQPYGKIFTLASAAQGEERLRRALTVERFPSTYEAELVRQDGSVVPVEVRASFLGDKEGKLIGILGIHCDISTRKALERQRAEFLALFTRDIKTPVEVILGYSDLLLEEARERDAKAKEDEDALERLTSNARTIYSLATNYLQLSRIEAGHLTVGKQPLLLTDLLRRVGRQYQGEARRRRITLEFHLQEGLPAVEGDTLGLEQIFTNLLNNALKFTPELGRVTVSATQQNGEVVIAVADTGLGIAPEEVATIFEKYRRVGTAQDREGVGLGLFIVKTLVEAHRGRLAVESTLGAGTCFSVFLPAAPTGCSG